MNELKKTMLYVGAAVILLLLAFAVSPDRITPESFLDQGDTFYPDFTDPNLATTLEVIEFDETSGTVRPFKVSFDGSRWTIPSHHNYPADGKDRLAQTAAAIIDIKKDDLRTNNVAEHADCGVVDPLDEAAMGTTGRGSRIKLFGSNGEILADFIIGKEVPNRQGVRFIRIAGQNRVYTARMNVDISTNFADWIETNLLDMTSDKVEEVVLNDYSINERTSRVEQKGTVTLAKSAGQWSLDGVPSGRTLDQSKVTSLLQELEDLTIVGVRPKPEGLSANLGQGGNAGELSQADRVSLSRKGFFFDQHGNLLSNEGELVIPTSDGVSYTLRFGEVFSGSGLTASAGTTDAMDKAGQQGPGENRYLFVTAQFNDRYFPRPSSPSSTEFSSKPDSLWTDADRDNKRLSEELDSWQQKVDRGREIATRLNNRFADWYYVISAEAYDHVRISRESLTKAEVGS